MSSEKCLLRFTLFPTHFAIPDEGTPMGPSFFWLPSRPKWPHVMSQHDLKAVLQEYVDAAAYCKEAGTSDVFLFMTCFVFC
jgi:2,4-dienoyl-CoA reductase-like NADH-dependent reductase (Old Yellow Enzyme family)